MKYGSRRPVVVQVREPCAAIASWYEVELAAGTVKESPAAWEGFMHQAAVYYRGFVRKWRPRAHLVLEHGDFMRMPGIAVEIVAGMMGKPLRVGKLTPRAATRVEDFRYYNQRTFRKLEMLCRL